MSLRCRLFGHRWIQHDTTFTQESGAPGVWMNDICTRCREPRNPLIYEEQKYEEQKKSAPQEGASE